VNEMRRERNEPKKAQTALEKALARKLERELLSRELKTAEPIGLRYDRVDLSLEPRGASYWYFLCNRLLISHLLAQRKRVLVACGRDWRRRPFSWEGRDVVRICPSSLASPIRKSAAIAAETHEGSSHGDSSFDAVVADSSILLSEDVAERLRKFRQLLKPGGIICVLAVNWEYEMAGENETHETSFRRYGGNIYLGLVKRTLRPAGEVEYISLLDPAQSFVRELASMEREELRALSLADVPEAAKAIISAEVIKIPQFTVEFLTEVCGEIGFSDVIISGTPGILALNLLKAVFWVSFSNLGPSAPAVGSTARLAAPTPASVAGRIMNEISHSLVHAFPFINSSDNPHIVAVCTR